MLLCFFYHLVLYLILKNLHKKSYVSLCFRSSSIFAAKLFNFSVRNGKRWDRFALDTRKFFLLESERFDRSNLDSRSPQAKKKCLTINTGRLNILLCLHLRPIKLMVCKLSIWKSNLEAGFVLRYFQYLSV